MSRDTPLSRLSPLSFRDLIFDLRSPSLIHDEDCTSADYFSRFISPFLHHSQFPVYIIDKSYLIKTSVYFSLVLFSGEPQSMRDERSDDMKGTENDDEYPATVYTTPLLENKATMQRKTIDYSDLTYVVENVRTYVR